MIFNADHKNDIQLRHYNCGGGGDGMMMMMMIGETMTTHKTDLH